MGPMVGTFGYGLGFRVSGLRVPDFPGMQIAFVDKSVLAMAIRIGAQHSLRFSGG